MKIEYGRQQFLIENKTSRNNGYQETSGCFPIWSDITYCKERPFNSGKQIGSMNIYVQCDCNIFNWVNKLANCLICYSIAQHELRKIS